jgi:hypothetical protein
MENNIVWIKENETNNIYCCELGKSYLEETDVVYEVNCIIGSFSTIIISRARTFKNPVPCTMFSTVKGLFNGYYIDYLSEVSTGMACYDIEKLK